MRWVRSSRCRIVKLLGHNHFSGDGSPSARRCPAQVRGYVAATPNGLIWPCWQSGGRAGEAFAGILDR